MASISHYTSEQIVRANTHFSSTKTIIETAFYGNNVRYINDLQQAYQMAHDAPNTIVLDQRISHPEALGLDSDSRILVANGGAVVGRTAKARRIRGNNPKEDKKIDAIIREAIYQASFKPFIASQAVVGLDEHFMIKAHIMMPEMEINNLYSWLLNFQIVTAAYEEKYKTSLSYDENDIFVFFDPSWSHPDYPDGLAYFDTEHNVTAILGMNYFGEIKKGTLTLAWATAARHQFVACHGGLKEFNKADTSYVASFFGLSGSGKSTLTHAKHDGKYDIRVLHDDAFVISMTDGSSIALEPSYFDKTNDYPAGHSEQDYFLTVQNCGVTRDHKGKRVLVTEDIRNGNGRTVKSRYATPNRVDYIDKGISSIFWIMKDDSLPPLVKVSDSLLASALGCTLMTKRSSAENVSGNLDTLVIVPYANPFRIYPLEDDFTNFYHLFESGVDCYIINTGKYLDHDISKETTLACIEAVVDDKASFTTFKHLKDFSYLDLADFPVDEKNHSYLNLLKDRMALRLSYLQDCQTDGTSNQLMKASISRLEEIVNTLTF